MAHVTYKVVRHEDGWAYTVNGAFSESFPTHADALKRRGVRPPNSGSPGRPKASSTRMSAASGTASFARGNDRPETDVEDTA